MQFQTFHKGCFLKENYPAREARRGNITVLAPHKGDFLKENDPAREARRGKITVLAPHKGGSLRKMTRRAKRAVKNYVLTFHKNTFFLRESLRNFTDAW